VSDKSVGAATEEPLGQRLRRYRSDAGLSPTELAERARVSKSYISSLESETEPERRPSAEILYKLARALGVAMSDLLGKTPVLASSQERTRELLLFALQYRLPESDIEMLASIQFRGDQPRTVERWRFIYEAIKNSELMDRSGSPSADGD
jgi:transcriptional regulator with XRE-family HTH domain